ncbi:MAG: tryptophan 7-halogenase [bacterium]|nr:tryptophan 7-halogenase [bacterium]
MARFVGERAVAHGVRHIVDHVDAVTLSADDRIDQIVTREHGPLTADLYVDCTGFRGLLIEEALGESWADDSASLLCDAAVVGTTPPDPAMPPFTRADALGAGWKWRIPLQSRLGHGYVFSSAFLDEDRAAAELIDRVGPEDGAVRDLRTLRFRVGRRRRPWRGNCVAVGLSASFLEPLESTGIHLIIEAVAEMIRCFPDQGFEPLLARRFNERAQAMYEELRDFLVLHYRLSSCDRGPFWVAQRNARLSESLAEALALYDATGLADWGRNSLFGDTSFQAIASGLGRWPRSPLPSTGFAAPAQIAEVFSKILVQNERITREMPRHAEMLGVAGGEHLSASRVSA